MNNQRTQLIKKYLQHMRQYKEGAVSKGNMLVSPPGVGKTQFVHFLANLLGIELVTIEAPHIVEEKLINIPFLVTKPATGTSQQGVTAVKVEPGSKSGPDNFDIQLADSYLFTQLVNAQHLTDQQYLQKVYKDANIKAMYEQLGGTPEKIPPLIADIRGSYRVILFIDEFFRTPSPTIAAILRTLLNKRIGMHHLPHDTYVTYASNLFDTGDTVAKRQQNQRFNMFIMKPATKVEWFDWLVNKFKDDNRGVKLNMNIIKKFGEILVDEDISSDFETTSGDIVRASPRRWEQLLLYVNAAFPMEDEQDAKSLITNVQINFLHYLDNEYHAVAKKVLKSVVELINKESSFKIKQSDVNSDIDWRHTLKHQIKIKQTLGDNRSYVPVISGPPGIGKTANAASVAQELNLRLIPIDASEIVDSGEVIGLPAPNVQAQGKINVKFVASKLFKQIYDIIDHEDKRYKANLMAKYSNEPNKAKEEYAKYEKSRWKYLIFFDELNRAPPQVMNALRRVILEKNFGEKDSEGTEMVLPREAIVMAAINPTGEGTSELTHHMRDVMDIIPGAASWDRQRVFLESKEIKGVSQEVREEIIKAFELMAAKFGFKAMSDQKRPFYWDVLGDQDGLYITPNDMSDIFAVASDSVQNTINDTLEENGVESVTELKARQLDQLDKAIKNDVYEAFESSLIAIFDTHELNGEDWVTGPFKSWVMKSDIGDALLKATSSSLTKRGDLKTILSDHLTPNKSTPLKDDSRFINYLKSKDHVTSAHEIEAGLNELVADNTKAHEFLAVLDTPQLVYDSANDELSTTDTKTSRLFNLLLEVGVALHANGFSGEVFSHIVGSMDELIDATLDKLRSSQLISADENNKLYMMGVNVMNILTTKLQ